MRAAKAGKRWAYVRSRTRVLQERRSLERVNEAFDEVLEGSAATPRLVFAL